MGGAFTGAYYMKSADVVRGYSVAKAGAFLLFARKEKKMPKKASDIADKKERFHFRVNEATLDVAKKWYKEDNCTK